MLKILPQPFLQFNGRQDTLLYGRLMVRGADMAIEGNDWVVVGAAGAAGAVAGGLIGIVIGSALGKDHDFTKSPIIAVRLYNAPKEKYPLDVEAMIVADFNKGGYTTVLANPMFWDDPITHPDIFSTPEEAAVFIDDIAKEIGFEPEGGWTLLAKLPNQGEGKTFVYRRSGL